MTRSGRWRTWALATAVVAAPSCVTHVVEEPPAQPVAVDARALVIPIGEARPRSNADRYYTSVLEQMREALAEGDLGRLHGLLAQHDRDDAPDWARQRMAGFRDAAAGLRFEAEAARGCRLTMAPEVPIGARLELRLELPGVALPAVVLGSGGTPVSFLVEVAIVDHDPFGGRTQHGTSRILRSERPVDLGAGEALDLPFELQVDAGTAVVRELRLRAQLLPGSITVDGRTAPVRRTEVAAHDEVLYPRGVAPIRAKPLLTLKNALASGDQKHFPHLYLAARFMPEAARQEASALLVDRVRLGRPDQARAAAAALRVMTGAPISVEDRAGWLRWWQER